MSKPNLDAATFLFRMVAWYHTHSAGASSLHVLLDSRPKSAGCNQPAPLLPRATKVAWPHRRQPRAIGCVGAAKSERGRRGEILSLGTLRLGPRQHIIGEWLASQGKKPWEKTQAKSRF